MIGALRYFVVEAGASLWRGRRSSLLSILTNAIALFMLGVFLLVSTNLERLTLEWGRAAEFSVYLHDGATPAERSAIESYLGADPLVASLDYVSKAQALTRFSRDFPDLAPGLGGSGENPLPASFEVRLAGLGGDRARLEQLAKSVATMAGVVDVRFDRRWLDRLASIGAAVRWTGMVLGAILMLAAALTVTSVVRLALFARRDEVEIMELVGAPMRLIRGPFVVEGVLQGGLGAVAALIALRVAFAVARPRIEAAAAGILGTMHLEFLGWTMMALVVGGGMVVGCLGGLVAARRLH